MLLLSHDAFLDILTLFVISNAVFICHLFKWTPLLLEKALPLKGSRSCNLLIIAVSETLSYEVTEVLTEVKEPREWFSDGAIFLFFIRYLDSLVRAALFGCLRLLLS